MSVADSGNGGRSRIRGGDTARFNSRLRVLKTELNLELGAPTRQVRSAEQQDKKSSQP